MSSSSKTPQPSQSTRDAVRLRMRGRATADSTPGRIETTTDTKRGTDDSRPTRGSQFPLTTRKARPQSSSKLHMGLRPSDASSKRYTSTPAPIPHSSYPQRTTCPSSVLVQSHRKELNDDRDRPLMLGMDSNYLKSSRLGLKLYRGDDDDNFSAMEKDDEGLEENFPDDSVGQWDAPYVPGPEADNMRHCLTWLRNVPTPGSFQAQDAPAKRE